MQLWGVCFCVCVRECGGREEVVVGSGVVLQSGTLAVWNAGRGQSRWELSTTVWETVSRLPARTHTRTHPPLTLSLVSRHKSVGAILRDQNEAGTDNLVWTQHCCCCCCLCQLGRQILKVCVSFLSLWNIPCSAQEVAIQFIYAVSDSCRHHKVSSVQDHMMEVRESGGMNGIYHSWNSSKCCHFIIWVSF